MARKSTEDIFVMIVSTISKFKSEGKITTTLAEICNDTKLASVVVSRYIPFFERIGKITTQEKVSSRGIERIIEITNFDLVLVV